MFAVDFDGKYLAFLWTHEEDLSFIFYSEVVAHVYQKHNLIGEKKLLKINKTQRDNTTILHITQSWMFFIIQELKHKSDYM